MPKAASKSAGDIAIIGIHGRFPKAENWREFWENLREGRNCIREIPEDRWNLELGPGKWGGFIENVAGFDPAVFRISPKEAAEIDPQQRLFLESVWSAMEDAGYGNHRRNPRHKIGLFVGAMWHEYSLYSHQSGYLQNQYCGPGSLIWAIANRTSFVMNFTGPSIALDTACSSSALAIHLACQSLLADECDMAVAGGINLNLHPSKYHYLAHEQLLAREPEKFCFQPGAEGYIPGEGVGSLVLKPLPQAVADGDSIYGVIKGTVTNHNGGGMYFRVPDSEGQARLIHDLFQKAGIDAGTISYIEISAFGSELVDETELRGLCKAFRKLTEAKQFCALGSLKPNTGHLEAASGVAQIIKVLLQMRHHQLAPGKFHDPLPDDFNLENTPFYLQRELADWKPILPKSTGKTKTKSGQNPRRAGISSFGAGGTNVYMIIEEYLSEKPLVDSTVTASVSRDGYLVVFSAETPAALHQYLQNMLVFLARAENQATLDLAGLEYTLQTGREAMKERIAFWTGSPEELAAQIDRYLKNEDILTHQDAPPTIFRGVSQSKETLSSDWIQNAPADELAAKWVQGATINWEQRYQGQRRKRISLPVYPFDRQRYWLNRCESTSNQAPTSQNLPMDTGRPPEHELKPRLILYFQELLGQELEIKPGNIDEAELIWTFGLDSLAIKRINAKLERDFGKLPASLFFEHQTLLQLADCILTEHFTFVARFFNLHDSQGVVKAANPVLPVTSFPITEPGGISEPIAIIGVSGRFPMAESLAEFWENLASGRDCITEIPIERWDYREWFDPDRKGTGKSYSKWGGFIRNPDQFDPLFFQITPREAELMDPQERLFLQTAWEAIEDAGYTAAALGKLAGSTANQVGVFAGVMWGEYQLYGVTETLKGNWITPSSTFWSIPNRVSYIGNFTGPSLAVDTACSSSLTAIHLACESLRRKECTVAIAGGVSLSLHPAKYLYLSHRKFASSDGKCRSFGEDGDGYVPGEGVGAVILKPLSQAQADHDHIYAVIRCSSVSHGGRTNGYTVPSPKAQADLIRNALQAANLDPRTLSYMEAHGTGTALGDPIEIEGLTRAFRAGTGERQFCAIGSLKSNIGHLEAAAGIAGLIKVLLQLKHRKLAPSRLNAPRVNSAIDFENSPFYLQLELSEWNPARTQESDRVITHPRRAGISSFGAGGANAFVVLEEYPGATEATGAGILAESGNSDSPQPIIFVLSAMDENILRAYAQKYIHFLEKECETPSNPSAGEGKELPLAGLAFTLQTGRIALEYRLAAVVHTVPELISRLMDYLHQSIQPKSLFAGQVPPKTFASRNPKKALASSPLQSWIAQKEYDRIAKAWVEGQDIDWLSLYPKPRPVKVSLPTYPFAGESYWIPVKEPLETISPGSQGHGASLHPLLGHNTSTLTEECFTTTFTGREFFLAEHLVRGVPTLPGVAYLEMARAAGELAGETIVSTIKDVIWIKPFQWLNQPETIRISLVPDGPAVNFIVTTCDDDGRKAIHAQGKQEYGTPPPLPSMDLTSVKARCPAVKTGAECYQSLESAGLYYGPTMRAIQGLWHNQTEALAQLVLPPACQPGFTEYGLHPVLMDGALQTVTVFHEQPSSRNDSLYLPFAIESLSVYQALPPNVYACATRVETPPESGFRKYHVQILDDNGAILVNIQGFMMRLAVSESTLRSGETTHPAVEVCYYTPEWTPAPVGVLKAGPFPGRIMIWDRDQTLRDSLLARYNRANFPGTENNPVILVKPGESFREAGNGVYEINPDSENDYRQLMAELKKQDMFPSAIIYRWQYSKNQTESQLTQRLATGIYGLFYLSQSLMLEGKGQKITCLCLYAGDRENTAPEDGALGAFFRAIHWEQPQSDYKTIRLPDNIPLDEELGIIEQELILTNGGIEICYEAGTRYQRQLMETVKPNLTEPKQLPLQQGGVYLITGGAGGLGLIFAGYLAKQAKARLILIGRSGLDAAQSEKTRELESFGAEVLYLRADTADKAGLKEAISQAKQRFQRINGVIHSAGVLRDSLMVKKTATELATVLAPKVFGTINLDEATRDESLDFFVLFSSTAGVLGNIGQADYAYGNSFMDHFARQREVWHFQGERYGKTLSINWPLWRDGGMQVDQNTEAWLHERLGMVPLTAEHGLQAFLDGLFITGPQLVVMEGDARRFQQYQAQSLAGSIPDLNPSQLPSDETIPIQLLPRVRKFTLDFLAGILSEQSKIPINKINVQESLENYGIDSVMILDLTRELERDFGSLSKTLFFEYQNLDALAGYFIQNHPEQLLSKMGETLQPEAASHRPETKSMEFPRNPARFFNPQSPSPVPVETDAIAIIGLSGRYPMADTLTQYWENLAAGKDCITEIPPDRWDWRDHYDPDPDRPGKSYSKWGGFLAHPADFDPLFFNITPRDAELMDPQERLFLETAWEVLEDAGYTRASLSAEQVGVFAGVMFGHYQLYGAEGALRGRPIALSSSHASIANRVSYVFNFSGPSIGLDTMCSSSLTAIHLACESLRRGESSMAIAGGVNLALHPQKYLLISQGRFASTDGRCRSFGSGGDGYVPGEGVGAVLLKPLSKAITAGDHIYGVIKSSAINHGGKTNGYTVPNPQAQAEVIGKTLRQFGIDPRTISFIEAHGTGTALGDPIEIAGLTKAFGLYTPNKQFCAIGSAKANIGHLESAAGIAGLTKVLLQMKYQQLVPSLHTETLNPHIDFLESPFYINRELAPWLPLEITNQGAVQKYPRRAGVSSFGAGGSNAHLIIEEYMEATGPVDNLTVPAPEPLLIPFSAGNKERLQAYVEKIRQFLMQLPNREKHNLNPADIAYTLQVGREAMEERMVLLASSLAGLENKLTSYINGQPDIPDLFQGNIRENTMTPFLDGTAGEVLLKTLLGQKDIPKLAQLWVAGGSIPWDSLYSGKTPRRISLPPHPFIRKRYWVPGSDVQEAAIHPAINPAPSTPVSLHPLLDRNTSTLFDMSFTKLLTGHEFYLAAHHVAGTRVLPGAAFIEMARAAGEIAGKAQVGALKNLVWLKPVQVGDVPREIRIDLIPAGNEVRFEVNMILEQAEKLLCATGELIFAGSYAGSALEHLDLEAIGGRCPVKISRGQLYSLLQQFQLNLGESFQVFQEGCHNDIEALYRLQLPAPNKDFQLHPALMDGAFHSMMAIFHQRLGTLYLPFSMGNFEIFKPLPDEVQVYARFNTMATDGSSHRFDLSIMDENGTVLVKVNDFTIRPIPIAESSVPSTVNYYIPEWVPTPVGNTLTPVFNGPILLLDTGNNFYQAWKIFYKSGESLSESILVKPGQDFQDISTGIFQIDPCSAGDYQRLITELNDRKALPHTIIFRWSCQPENQTVPLHQKLQTGVYSLYHLTKALLKQIPDQNITLLYLYHGTRLQLPPENAAIAAFCKTVRLEHPKFRYQTIALPDNISTEEELATLSRELNTSGSPIELCYESGQRYAKNYIRHSTMGLIVKQDARRVTTPDTTPFIKPRRVYLITGGVGGLGLIFAEYIARTTQAKLVLLGRSELNPVQSAKINELESLGAEVLYLRADISSRSGLETALQTARNRFGTIHGVIHSAGVIRDSYLINKTVAEIDVVFAPKLDGTINLDEATQRDMLDFFVLFSSTTGVLGNAGQTDYAYANCFMDCFARQREILRSQGKRSGKTLSINWPLWRDGGMQVDSQTENQFRETMGLVPLDTESGLAALEFGLNQNQAQLLILSGEPVKLDWLVNSRQQSIQNIQEPMPVANNIAMVSQEQTEELLIGSLSKATKIPAAEIQVQAPFEDYGIDSVMMITLTRDLEQQFGELSKTLFFEYRNLKELAGYFLKNHAPQLSQLQNTNSVLDQTGESLSQSLPSQSLTISTVQILPTIPVSNTPRHFLNAARTVHEITGEIAIIGLDGRYPLADDLEKFWDNLQHGKDCITEIPEERWNWRKYYDSGHGKDQPGKAHSKWGGFIRNFHCFDPLFFNISPREAELMDPQERLFLETAWRAMEDAGYTRDNLFRQRVGVFVGVMYGQYQLYGTEPVTGGSLIPVNSSYASIANRVSYIANFSGPSMAVDTMCSSSLTAIHLACQSIRYGECELAIAGGVNLSLHPMKYVQLAQGNFTSSDGRCRSFGAGGDGYVPGEGVGAVILKPLARAIADGDRIYGVIKATGVNHGGKTTGYTVPNPNAQAEVIGDVLKKANISPRTISYLEAHGTGTALGDPIEITGLMKAFNQSTPDREYCAIGSVKSNIGHLESAAGIAGLTKVLLQMKYRQLFPSLHGDNVNPHINFAASPFHLQRELADWEQPVVLENGAPRKYPRRAGISSFGAGGANAHIIVEEYEPAPVPMQPPSSGPQLILLSAKNEERLQVYARKIVEFLKRKANVSSASLRDLAFTLQTGREALDERLALVADNLDELLDKLEAFCQCEEALPNLFRGNLKSSLKHSHLLVEGNEGREFIKVIIGEHKLHKLAQLWVSGVAIDWNLLYTAPLPKRIELPTYPFAMEPYWLELPAKSDLARARHFSGSESSLPVAASIHPLLHRNTSDFSEQRFSSTFTGRELFLADHQVNGHRILPGAAHLEMARAAVEVAMGITFPESGSAGTKDMDCTLLELKNIRWFRPLSVGDQPVTVHIGLLPGERGEITYEIYSDSAATNPEPVIYSQGNAILSPSTQIPSLDLAAIQARCVQGNLTSGEVYSRFRNMGLEYGPAHQGIEQIYQGEGQVLAKLTLPPSASIYQDSFGLHPSLLDASFQAVIGLMINSAQPKPALPIALQAMQIFRKCPDNLWAWIRYGGLNQAFEIASPEMHFDIDICDDQGNICIQIKSLVLHSPDDQEIAMEFGSAAEKVKSTTGAIFLEPFWEEHTVPEPGQNPITASPEYLQHLVFLCEPAHPGIEQIMESQLSGVCCIAFEKQSNSSLAIGERFAEFGARVFEEIRQILIAKPRGQVLVQIVCFSQGEQWLWSGLSGLLRTARKENPRFIGQLIECEAGEEPEIIISRLRENRLHPQDCQIRYQAGKRLVSCWREAVIPVKSAVIPWKNQGVYLITGGAGGLGMIFAEEIALQVQHPTLILTGRSGLDGTKQAKIRELEKLGAQVQYRQVDVARNNEVKSLIESIRTEFGGLNGIIHSAGVIRDNFIIKKNREEFKEVLDPKVTGLANLDQASQDIHLDFMILFSSTAGSLGNAGQADYSTANAFMDAYTRYRNQLVASNQRHGRTLSINWPLWKDGGMTVSAETRQHFTDTFGMIPMRTSTGIQSLYQALSSDTEWMMILEGDPKQLKTIFLKSQPGIGANPTAIKAATADKKAGTLTPGLLQEKAIHYFKNLLSSIIKLPPERIDPDEPMETYGIDSVMILQLTGQLEKDLGPLPKTIFFEYQTIRELSNHFLDCYHEQFVGVLGLTVQAAATVHRDSNLAVPVDHSKSTLVRQRHSRFTSFRAETAGGPADIAIIGISGQYPQANNLQEFWDNLRSGKDCITEIPKQRWDYSRYFDKNPGKPGKASSKWGGFLEDVAGFDPLFFNIPPREAEMIDPQERLFLQCVWHTLEDAGYNRDRLAPGNVGVFVGVMWGQYQLFESVEDGMVIPGASSYASIANRISYYFNLHGPSIALDTMCSSSLNAIHLACESIFHNGCEMAIAGGINLSLHPNKYLLLSRNRFLASDGRCRSFGADGDGYVPGEGLGAVLLKPLKRAISDGDHIYAVIKGSALNHGGKTNGYTVPNPHAQAEVITKALKQSQIDPGSISYLEAHGTGTSLGDPIEISGLTKAFREYNQERQYCPIGSVKSNIGHLEAAAGIAALTKVILQMQHRQLVPSLHASPFNPNIDFSGSPFYIQTELAEWTQPLRTESGRLVTYPRRAGISSFGAGGANAHLIVEEYETPQNNCFPLEPGPQLMILSAKNEERLKVYAGLWADFLDTHPSIPLVQLAYNLQTGRDAMEERLALIVSSHLQLRDRLRDYSQGQSQIPDVYHGNIKTGRTRTEFLSEDRESAEYLKIVIAENKLHKLAQLWISGVSVDWRLLYQLYPELPHRLPLPVYPFTTEPYWMPQANLPAGDVPRLVESTMSINDTTGNPELSVRNPALDPSGKEPKEVHHSHTNIQNQLLDLFAGTLKIPVAQFDPDTSLADYGVDSILLMELVQKLETIFSAKMEPSLFIAYPTLRALGNYFEKTYAASFTAVKASEEFESNTKAQPLEVSKTESSPSIANPIPGQCLMTASRGPVTILSTRPSFQEADFRNYWKNNKTGIPETVAESDWLPDYLQLTAKYRSKILHLLVTTATQQKMEVIISGSGPTLLLINGFGLTAPQWLYQFKEWSSRYQLVVIHNPGTGLSETGTDCSFSGISKIYMEVLNHLPVKWPIHVVGASWGGMIAQTLALEYPERIASLVLSGSMCRFTVDLSNYRLRELFQKDFDNESSRQYFPLIGDSEAMNPLAIPMYFANARSKVSLVERLPEIKIPTLIIAGKQDQVVDPEESRLIHSQITGSVYHELISAGHVPNLTHHPEFNQIVSGFIDFQIRQGTIENQRWYVFRKPKTKARMRLFCFHSGLEGASLYRWWHTKLPPDIEVCPVQMPGRENRATETPVSSVEEALQALERVLVPKLDLPFAFYGHRLGALVAFYLAIRLRAHHFPGLKHLCAGACPGPAVYPNLYLKSALQQFQAMGYSGIPGLDRIEELITKHQPELLKIPALKFNGIRNPKMIRTFLPLVLSDLKLMEDCQNLYPEPVDFPITVFYGTRDFLLSKKEAESWQQSTKAGCKVYPFSGDHQFLSEDQNQTESLTILVQELNQILDF